MMFFEFSIGFASFYFYKANKFIFRKITESDSRRYENKEGKLHREDGPVVESLDGTKEWFVDGKNITQQQFNDYVNSKSTMIVEKDGTKIWKNKEGQYHRVDGPAIEYASGSKEWYFNGFFHHEDGPACEYADGTKEWFVNGKLHREDGPAVEWADGHKEWFVNGLLHREDGPACEYANGKKIWFVNNKELTEQQFNDYVNSKSTMTVDEYGHKHWKNNKGQFHRVDGPAVEYSNGTKEWFVNGKLHREDGPAVEWHDGVKQWYVNGSHLLEKEFNDYVNSKSTMTVDKYGHKLWQNNKGQFHRVDGPAVEGKDGSNSWYVNGERHREDGPACEYVNGYKAWFVDGKELTQQQFNDYANSKSTMAVDKYGNKFWKNNKGQLHRVNGPALEWTDGTKQWFVNGDRHREDGPAVEWSRGGKEWWENGKLIKIC